MTHAVRRLGARLVPAVLVALLVSACCCPERPDDVELLEEPDPRKSAQESFGAMKLAVSRGLVNRFYYLLEHSVRDRLPYHVLANRWDEVQPALEREILNAEFVSATEIEDEDDWLLPQGNNVLVKTSHKNAAGEPVESTLLFVLELDPARWPSESTARWRVAYPWKDFQATDAWFAALGLPGPGTGAGGTPPGGNVSDGHPSGTGPTGDQPEVPEVPDIPDIPD